jgi:predicted glycoside hydrolase/deacetylase ChbG (UPF0249 family)
MRASTRPVSFIVNADDLGGSESINSAIFAGIADGVVSSATIMATGPAVESAIRSTKDFPNASFGVHLNLTDHRPLTANPALAPLLVADGGFAHRAIFNVRWTKRLVDAVVEEWSAQVARVRREGVPVSHLDSHEHVHTIPGLFVALKRVQRRTGIRRVRGTWSVYDRKTKPSARLRASKRAWWWALRHVYATRTTAEFSDFLIFLKAVSEGSYAPRPWPAAIELMVHPGGEPAGDTTETATLRSGWLQTLPTPAELVSYNAL